MQQTVHFWGFSGFSNLPNKIETLQGPLHGEETGGIGREGTNHDGTETAEHSFEATFCHDTPLNTIDFTRIVLDITCIRRLHLYIDR